MSVASHTSANRPSSPQRRRSSDARNVRTPAIRNATALARAGRASDARASVFGAVSQRTSPLLALIRRAFRTVRREPSWFDLRRTTDRIRSWAAVLAGMSCGETQLKGLPVMTIPPSLPSASGDGNRFGQTIPADGRQLRVIGAP